MVSVACFGVNVAVMFHLMFVHYSLCSGWVAESHVLRSSCPLGSPYVLIVFRLFVIFIYIPVLVLRAEFWF